MATAPLKTDPNSIVSRHRLVDACAIVCADGSASLMNVVYAKQPDGVQIVGNGTCPHPLDVKLSPARQHADDLVVALREALARLERVDIELCKAKGCTTEYQLGEITRGRALLQRIVEAS